MKNHFPAIPFALFLLCFMPVSARYGAGHCDTLDGPVIQDARSALERSDVTPVLKWIGEDSEPEIRAAFEKALDARKTDRDRADLEFFETLVRVHRAGEGAGFSGLKPAGSVDKEILEADKALETGSADDLMGELSGRLGREIRTRLDRAIELKKHKDETVAQGREYVRAYVDYVHYMEGVHKALAGEAAHHPGGAEEAGDPDAPAHHEA